MEAFKSFKGKKLDEEFAKEVLKVIRAARSNPRQFAPILEDMLKNFEGSVYHSSDGKTAIQTKEGPTAVQEAIEFMKTVEAVPVVEWNDLLAKNCEKHVLDIGPKGLL